jgi:K+-sensing histidine kinase KdpD
LRVLDGNFYQGFERKLTPLKLDVDEESPLLDENARAPQSTQAHRRSVVIEYRVCNPSNNNEILWLESTVLLHEESKRGNNGTITSTALMLLSRDVTDRNTERDLIRRENAAKLQYITCCAHDLKTPLQSFSSALDLLLSTELNADQKDICNQAEISLSLMNLTIAQTMDTSKALMVSICNKLILLYSFCAIRGHAIDFRYPRIYFFNVLSGV